MNYLSGAGHGTSGTPYELIGVYVLLSFLQGGGIGELNCLLL